MVPAVRNLLLTSYWSCSQPEKRQRPLVSIPCGEVELHERSFLSGHDRTLLVASLRLNL